MREIYRKRGRSVRYENGVFINTSEAGEAIEDGLFFECRPIAAAELPEFDSTSLRAAVEAIRDLVVHPVSIERLVLTEGVVEHTFGEQVWSEKHRRIHLSLTHRSIRALVDTGDFQTDSLEEIVRALRDTGPEGDPPLRARLAPRVSAAVLPLLAGVTPPNVTLMQSGGGFDGKGDPIEMRRIESPPWPNWYRPGYRVRPLRAPLNIRARCDVTQIERELPRAVALMGPVESFSIRVLLEDAGRTRPATLQLVRIESVADDAVWFPYGSGSFGAEMVL